MSDYIADASLFCLLHRGRQILEWSTPHNRTRSETRLTTSDCSGDGLFCSTLTLSKAVANETGEYRCFYKSLPIEDGKTSVAVYVFIQGMIFTCNFVGQVFNKKISTFFIVFDSFSHCLPEKVGETVGMLQKCLAHTSFVVFQDNLLTSSFFITSSFWWHHHI